MERDGIHKRETNTSLSPYYSYYQILIVEGAQPITYVAKHGVVGWIGNNRKGGRRGNKEKEGPVSYGGIMTQEVDDTNLDQDDTFVACPADLPEAVWKLQKQLLAGYRPPNHPPINDPRGCHLLTEFEELSLKHFMAWVDSHGTVKAYSLHAQILQKATNIEILSLYMV